MIDTKTFGWITTIIWAMLFCFNMILWLHTRDQGTLFLAGAMLGGTIIYLLTIPHVNWQTDFIERILKRWGDSLKLSEKLLKLTKKKKRI